VGGIIGSGIFMLPTLLAPYGMMGFIAWVITGAGAILLALMLAELSRRIPKLGGPYAYAREGFGDFIGFWIGWGYWISMWAAMAAVAVACVGYVAFFIPVLKSNSLLSTLTTLVIIWALTLLNIHSMRISGQFQLIATVLKILPLLFIGLLGITMGSVSNLPELNPAGGSMLGAIATSVTLVMWAFAGMEAVTVPADDIEDPGKTIPKILVWGTITVLAIYLIAFTGVTLLVPASVLLNSTAPFADASVVVIGSVGAAFIAVGAIIATMGTLNMQVLISGQIVRAIALDRLFPQKLGELGKGGTPTLAILVSASMASVLVIMSNTQGLVAAFRMMILLATLSALIPLAFASIAALLFLSRDAPSASRLRAMLTASLAFLYTMLVIIGAGAQTVFYGFILLMAALPVYVFVKK
jgi:APA family basic amino acid/polyamine antiporter